MDTMSSAAPECVAKLPDPPLPPPPELADPFKPLLEAERRVLGDEKTDGLRVEGKRVAYDEKDRVGLALSGGGIRSATFCLGVLQGLHSLGLLALLDYLSTVSGGGYIGGWWTAWRNRKKRESLFPEPQGSAPCAREIRHLREFSNFLCPRKGFFESETWGMVATVLGGMVPTAATALAMLVLLVTMWLATVAAAFGASPGRRLALPMVMAGAVLILCEIAWRKARKACTADRCGGTYAVTAAIGVATSGLVFSGLLHMGSPATWGSAPWQAVVHGPFVDGLAASPWHLLAPAGAWLGGGVAILLLRALLAPCIFLGRAVTGTGTEGEATAAPRNGQAQWSAWLRPAGRLLALACAWTVLALLWWLGQTVREVGVLQAVGALGAAGSGGAFSRLMQARARHLAKGGDRSGKRPSVLASSGPTILAYLAMGLLLILVSAWTGGLLLRPTAFSWLWLPVGAFLLVLLVLFAYDPMLLGLHEYYRSRIARAYLGASAAPPGDANHETQECGNDDMPLEHTGGRPLHLICATANDLGGDPLPNLSRGAYSAVLSCCGLSVDGKWQIRTDGTTPSGRLPMLSASLTGAAAAFNTNMGALSVALGLPGTFLTAALNLRLGLWVGVRGFPRGWPLFLEMFGWTRVADGQPVHLSDGGHFENMALYELIRRRCRYIVVCDCGADPAMAFCDLGRAERRIREDFGTEIEIDVSPLCPDANGLARQHVAVGTIHYDGPTGADKGILVLVKPVLTGDEPADVQHYRSTSPDFPQQTTLDQFYDEAQWESYRRLGEHAIRSGLRCVEGLARKPHGAFEPGDAPAVFGRARQHWYPSPPGFEQGQAEADRCHAAFEARFWREAPPRLRQEFFRETASDPRPPAPSPSETVGWLLDVQRHMEELHSLCRLGTYWNHPRNAGWMNLMLRWTDSPTFRAWWPVLRPLRDPAFREFAEAQLAARQPLCQCRQEVLRIDLRTERTRAELLLERSLGHGDGAQILAGKSYLFVGRIELATSPPTPVVVQALPVRRNPAAPHQAEWSATDFLALPGLWGSGFGSDFVRQIHRQLADCGFGQCQVTVGGTEDQRHSDAGSRRETIDRLAFYRSNGYTLLDQQEPPVLRRHIP